MPSDGPTPPAQRGDPLVGTRLGEYEVLEPIGEGGMGVVYRGVQPVIKKRVAIKVLKPTVSRDANHVRRLTDEAEAVNSIRHRNIIDIFSLGQLPDGRPYIVMEFLEGRPLDSYVASVGRLQLAEALNLLIAVCGPLAAAHRANVIHRDLKPSNIFVCVSDDGERYLKLLDFGLAKKAMSVSGSTEQTSRAQVIGTPNYMAPEQAKALQVSARTDIYALGVMAFEFVTGQLPFHAAGPFEMLSQHVNAKIPSARAVEPLVPEALDALIARMMAKAPEARVQTVEEVRATLKEVAQTVGPGATFETRDTVSGKFGTAQLFPRATPMASRPVDDASADTMMSQRSMRQARVRRLGAGVGTVVLGAMLAVLGMDRWSRRDSAPLPPLTTAPIAPIARLPAVPAPDNPSTVPASAPSVVPPGAAHAAAGLSGTPATDAKPPSKAVDVPTEPKPVAHPAPKREPPSVEALRARVAKLDAALAQNVPAGEDPDPSAVSLLRKYKVQATMADTAEDRASLAKNLDAFERTFLKR